MKHSLSTVAVAGLTTLAVAAGSLSAVAKEPPTNTKPTISFSDSSQDDKTVTSVTVNQDKPVGPLTVNISGGDGPTTAEVVGELPTGLTFANGELSGTPKVTDWGSSDTKKLTVKFRITDENPADPATPDTVEKTVTINVKRTEFEPTQSDLNGGSSQKYVRINNFNGEKNRVAVFKGAASGEKVCDTSTPGSNNFLFKDDNCVEKSPLNVITEITGYITAIVGVIAAVFGLYTAVKKFVPDLPSLPGL
ncbi:MAG: hypothetical protein SPI77_06610 [Corynebacterium sp.]|nr:hypothetical protein [Corynebacterium sp.]